MLEREGVTDSLIMIQPTLFACPLEGPPYPVLLDVASLKPDMPQLDTFVSDSKLMGMPFDSSFLVTTVNKNDFAKAGVGVSVKVDAPKPNIATVEAFKTTMLNAKSIGYSNGGPATSPPG